MWVICQGPRPGPGWRHPSTGGGFWWRSMRIQGEAIPGAGDMVPTLFPEERLELWGEKAHLHQDCLSPVCYLWSLVWYSQDHQALGTLLLGPAPQLLRTGTQSVLCWATTSTFSYMKGGAILGTCGLNCRFVPTLGKGPSWDQNAPQEPPHGSAHREQAAGTLWNRAALGEAPTA